MTNCPTCGQPIKAKEGDRTELLRALEARGPGSSRPVYTYKGRDGQWHITFTRGPQYSQALVFSLVAEGLLSPVYPGADSEREAYGLKSYYGTPGYIRDIQWRLNRRASKRSPRPMTQHSRAATEAPRSDDGEA